MSRAQTLAICSIRGFCAIQFLLQGLKRDDIVMIPVNLHQHSLVHRGHLLVHLSYAVKLIVDLLELRVHDVGHHVGVSPRDEDATLRAVSMTKRE